VGNLIYHIDILAFPAIIHIMELFDEKEITSRKWLTTAEVLKYLGIEIHILRSLRTKGRIVAYEPTPYLRQNMDLPARTVIYKAEDVVRLKKEIEVPRPAGQINSLGRA